MLPGTKVTAVGTSTNCSGSCGSKRTVRCGMASCEILGTAMTCSGIAVSKSLRTSTSWSTICSTGASRSSTGTGTKDSIICSAVCCWIRSCGPRGSTRPVGRVPHLPHRTARRTPCPRPHWSSTCSTWPPWSLPCSVPVGRRAARAFPPTPP